MTTRMLPPPMMGSNPGNLATPVKAGARNYSASPGSTLDVPDYDVSDLVSAGWIALAHVGPTTARPQNTIVDSANPAAPGMTFIDTTLGLFIVCDGMLTWRNPVTGAAV